MPTIGGFMKLSSQWSAATARVLPARLITFTVTAHNWNRAETDYRWSRTAQSDPIYVSFILQGHIPHRNLIGVLLFSNGTEAGGQWGSRMVLLDVAKDRVQYQPP